MGFWGFGVLGIPKRLRDRFGIEAGTELRIVETESGIHLDVPIAAPTVVRTGGRRVVRTGHPLSAETVLAVRDELRR